ncbi:MAG: DUF2851 family protein [Chloroflexi bacterium]|nr:DUF2851 family protein [Chloroflexota bacterium]
MVNERLICHIWQEQRLAKDNLTTSSGRPLQVVYRGRRCANPGPDFRDALLTLDGCHLLHGDIEVHVRSSDWYRHGHHHDVRYNKVILHVVMWPDEMEPTLRADGEPVAVLALADLIPVEDPLPTIWEEPNPHAARVRSAASLNGEAAGAAEGQRLGRLLEEMGEERMRQRAVVCEAEMTVSAAGQVLYERIMDALGDSQNTSPFRELSRLLPLSTVETLLRQTPPVRRGLVAQALFLGAAGFLPLSSEACPGEASPLFAEMVQEWQTRLQNWVDQPLSRQTWRMAGVRPANFPQRRLVAAAHLFAQHAEQGLMETLLSLLKQPNPRRAQEGLERALLVPNAATSGDALPGGPEAARLGPARARDILINTILPWAFAYGQFAADDALTIKAIALYRIHPKSAPNAITRYMAEEILGLTGSLINSARRQQGLLHIYKQWCRAKACPACPVTRERGSCLL